MGRRNESGVRRAARRGPCRAAALLVASATAACGAKTGLDVPCTIPLAPATTRVVVLVDHSSAAGIPYHQIIYDGGVRILALFGLEVQALNQTLPALEAAPLLAPTATGLYVFPEISLADLAREGACATPTTMLLPITPAGVSPLLDQLHQWDHGSGNEDPSFWPSGSQPVAAALGLARAALNADGGRAAPRFIVLATEGESACNAAITPATCSCFTNAVEDCLRQPEGVRTCSDQDRVVATVADLRTTDEIRTLVLGDDFVGNLAFTPAVAFFDAVARAGGLSRSGARTWYGYGEPAETAAAMGHLIAPAGWCWPHAVRPPRDPADWILVSTTRGTVSQDASHLDGWDWVDASSGSLRLYGAACDAAMADRGGIELVAQHQRCSP